MRSWFVILTGIMLAVANAASAAITYTPDQQRVVDKLKAKGALIMQVANDTDALSVNLSLAGKSCTDEDVAMVKDLPKVQQVNLAGTAVTDAGLVNLEGFKDLDRLHIERTNISDEGVAHLAGLENLTYLNLYETKVTDKGVAKLAGLKKLKNLYVWKTEVTDAGAAELAKAIPGIDVNRGSDLTPVPPLSPPPPYVLYDQTPQPNFAKLPDAEKPKKAGDSTAQAPPVPAKETKESTATAAAKPINSKCPVSGHDIDPAFTVLYDGKTVGLCCGKCKAKFTSDPKAFADKIVADVKN